MFATFTAWIRGTAAYLALLGGFACIFSLYRHLETQTPVRIRWGTTPEKAASPPPAAPAPAITKADAPPPPPRQEPAQPELDPGSGIPLVIVDAGHGAGDGGAVANGLIEKNVALTLALKLREQLLAQGLRVKMTRGSDTFLPLEERAALANREGAAAFISVHLNSAGTDAEVNGIETYFSANKSLSALRAVQKNLDLPSVAGLRDHRGKRLAAVVQRMVCQTTKAANRGIKERDLTVVFGSACPAVLVECGFLTHAAEAKRLQNPDYQDKLALGLARGVTSFLHVQELDPLRGVEIPPPAATEEPLLSENKDAPKTAPPPPPSL